MSTFEFIFIFWCLPGLLGTIIQIVGQLPKEDLTLTNGIKLSLIGLVMGPINLLATFEKRKDE
ncbi:MAG: hypothetical protein ACXAAH_17060 [Promethearchaeota archaeon]|jgi:hypothetical protein